ncbi:MAG: DUF4337 domain-containing protein [Syntrophobacterales bacterium]|nr:DUF4337 domain-containing protein [Syntrophobacterales bacterium]
MAEIELPEVEELEEARKDAFTRRVALTTAIFAVLLAITSLGGSNAMKEMLLAQQQASNMWAYYQAKVIREHLYRSQAFLLEAMAAGPAGGNPSGQQKIQEARSHLLQEAQRFNQEKKEIEKDARQFEAERDLNQKKDPSFDYAEVLLQIAIVLASIAIISQSPRMYYFAIATAILGGAFSVNGFFLLVSLPFFR